MNSPNVRTQSSAVAAMANDWPLLTALIGGTPAMRAAGKKFLPQFPGEDDEAYKARLGTAVLTNLFGRTCSIMASKPFSKEIKLENVPPAIDELIGDIDGKGSDLHSFGETILRMCLSHGINGVLVDYPAGPAARSRAEEQQTRRRVYWSMYPAETILGFKAKRVGGEWVLLQLRLLEMVTEEDGRFGEKDVEQVRVLEPGIWELWRRDPNDQEKWILHEQGTTTLNFIPFKFFYGVRTGFGTGKSPILDLAFLNAEHWQSSSDQQNILHVARVPILFGRGFAIDTAIKIGSSSAVLVSDEKAELKFVEHTGAAIDAGRQAILDLEDRMRHMGADLLVKRRVNVTATQVASEGEADKCVLQTIVETLEDGINDCLGYTATWIGEAGGGEVELFKDFGVDSLSDASAQLLLNAASTGVISRETFFEEMRRRSIIDSDRAWSDEQTRIAAQPPITPKADPAAPKPQPE